jgi:hypothetical protein
LFILFERVFAMKKLLSWILICAMMMVLGCATQPAKETPKVQPAAKAAAEPKKVEAAPKPAEPTKTADGQLIQYVDTPTGRWKIHDMDRPAPKVITPGDAATAPSDAVVLFDGKDLSQWTSQDGSPAKWVVKDGFMETVKGTGMIKSKELFGSCQLHVEFATPTAVSGTSQGRGNSGVFLMDYEIQVLDSFDNKTYPDGQCAALYGRAVPLVNACRQPGQWQTYDIIFHRPIFKGKEVVRKPTFTVIHNGVLVQDHVELTGGTQWNGPNAISDFRPHPDKMPIQLQDHSNPVRFRNIWVRPLAD